MAKAKAAAKKKSKPDLRLPEAIIMDAQTSEIDRLIRGGASITDADPNGQTPLHEAVSRDRLEVVAMLISAGADTNAPDFSRETPLFHACSVPVAQRLLAHGADIHATDEWGKSVLHAAALRSSLALVELYLMEGAAQPHTAFGAPIATAAQVASPDVIARLLEAGADIEDRGMQQQTPFLLAAGQVEPARALAAAQLLASRGANVNVTDEAGRNALHHACFTPGNLELVRFLVEDCKLYLHQRDTVAGETCLHDCVLRGDLAMFEYLLAAGADPKDTSEGRRSCLQLAMQREADDPDTLAIATKLLDLGADPNAEDEYGCSVLGELCEKWGSLAELATLLLARGARVKPEHVKAAKTSKNAELVKLLEPKLSKSAAPKAKPKLAAKTVRSTKAKAKPKTKPKRK